jgi:hypothetical protein
VDIAAWIAGLLADAWTQLETARPLPLALAVAAFAAAPATVGAAWGVALRRGGARVTVGGACARYATGSLVNSFAPGRIGDAVRLGLLARTLPGSRCRGVAHVVAVLEPARIATLLAVALASVEPWAGVAGLLVVPLARRTPAAAMAVGAVLLKTAALALGLWSLHDGDPIGHALRLVPALELAGLLPLTPANAASATLASAVVLHGAAPAAALHALETAGGVAFGLTGAVSLLASELVARLRRPPVAVAPA